MRLSKRLFPRVAAPILFLPFLIGFSGCSNNQCSDAKKEETRLAKEMETIAGRFVITEEKLRTFIEEYCSDLESGDKPLLDMSFDDIWCDDWRETDNIPPIGGPESQRLSNEIEDLKRKFEIVQKRWALTITTYKECFEPSKVIDATELLKD